MEVLKLIISKEQREVQQQKNKQELQQLELKFQGINSFEIFPTLSNDYLTAQKQNIIFNKIANILNITSLNGLTLKFNKKDYDIHIIDKIYLMCINRDLLRIQQYQTA